MQFSARRCRSQKLCHATCDKCNAEVCHPCRNYGTVSLTSCPTHSTRTTMRSAPVPPAFVAIDAYPHLRRQVALALEAQARRVADRAAHFIPRPAVVKALD